MVVGGRFDPSREWLGIDAVELSDAFRALGLSPAESDPDVVTAAAERLLTRLGGVDPGPFRLAHESLQRRIEACRDEALAVVAARPRPTPAADAGGFVSPPPPPNLKLPTADGPPIAAIPPLPSYPASTPLVADPVSPPPGTDDVEADPASFQLRRPVRRRTANSAAPAFMSLLAVAAGLVAAYVLWPQPGSDGEQRPQRTAAERPRAPRDQEPAPPAVPPAASPPAFTPAAAAAASQPDGPLEPLPPRRRRRMTPRPAADMEPTVAPQPAFPQAAPLETPTEPPAPAPPTPEQRARSAAAAERALAEAYKALRRGDFNVADRQVAAAARLAADDEQLDDRVICWQQLALYARQFPQHRDAAIDASVGEDYDLRRGDGSVTRIAIVEANANEFKYRSAGITKRVARSDIPQPIVTAIMRKWFAAHDQAGNHVLMGVYHLTKAEPDPTAARRAWQQARQMGGDVSNLEPLLDDPLILAGGGGER